MKIRWFILFLLIFCIIGRAQAKDVSALTLVKKIPLYNVKGRIDHLAIDFKDGYLFVAALGNNTVEVVNLRAGKQIQTITGFSEPQNIIFLPEQNKIYVSNAGNGECEILETVSFSRIGNINFNSDADNMRYDDVNGRIYIGFGSGDIGVINTATEKKAGEIALLEHPEAMEIEARGDRLFINLPGAGEVVVVNRKNMTITDHWYLTGAVKNFPMALDETGERLYVGCRNPAKLIVFDTQSGDVVGEQNIDQDADDIFYDSKNNLIYVSCGQGFIDVIARKGISDYNVTERIPTASGARTSLFVPENGRFYLAVPAGLNRKAEIWVYEPR